MLKSINKILVIIIIIILATAAGGYIWYQRHQSTNENPPVNKQTQQHVRVDAYKDWETYRNEKYGFEVRFPEVFNFSEDISILRSENKNILVYLYGEEGLDYYTKSSDQYCEGTSCWPLVVVKHYQTVKEFLSDLGWSDVKNINSINDINDLESFFKRENILQKTNMISCGQKSAKYLIGSEENAHFMKEDYTPIINYTVLGFNTKGIFTMEFTDVIVNDVNNSEMVKSFVCSL